MGTSSSAHRRSRAARQRPPGRCRNDPFSITRPWAELSRQRTCQRGRVLGEARSPHRRAFPHRFRQTDFASCGESRTAEDPGDSTPSWDARVSAPPIGWAGTDRASRKRGQTWRFLECPDGPGVAAVGCFAVMAASFAGDGGAWLARAPGPWTAAGPDAGRPGRGPAGGPGGPDSGSRGRRIGRAGLDPGPGARGVRAPVVHDPKARRW